MPRWLDRLMGRPVSELVDNIESALGELAHAKGQRAACEEALRLANDDLGQAHKKVRAAREALFREHPELLEEEQVQPDGYEVVEVDDPNDPRYAGGFTEQDGFLPSPSSDTMEWTEHDG